MSRVIDTVTIGGIVDKRLVLGNAQVARVLNVGTWTTLRIGVRFCFDDFGGIVYGPPRLCIGLLSSPSGTNGPLGETTSHFVGFRTAANFLRTTTAGIVYYAITTNGVEFCSKVGNTVTSLFNSFSNNMSATPATNIWPIFIELTKAGPGSPVNWSMSLIHWNQTIVNRHITKAEMLTAMETSNSTTLTAYMDSLISGTPYTNNPVTGTISVNEATNGTLDSVCVAWDRTSPLVRISEIMWRKIA